MVPEIPVFAWQILDVRTHRHEPAAGSQAPANLVQRAAERGLVGEMLEKIAREHHVERVVRQRPGLEQSC